MKRPIVWWMVQTESSSKGTVPFLATCAQHRVGCTGLGQINPWKELPFVCGGFDKTSVAVPFPWHHNYVRAIAIHLRDMIMLRDKHPGIFAEFCKGKFTVNKTRRPFSRTALDESHEQNNACVKGDGRAVGLIENSSALLRWMVSGPEMSQCFRREGNSITASSPRGPATWLNLFWVYVVFFPPFLIPTVFGTTDDC